MDMTKQRQEKVYIKFDQSVAVDRKKVTIEDVASVYCKDKDISEKIKKIDLYQFIKDGKEREIITALKVIECIQKEIPDADITNIGCSEFIVYYKPQKPPKKGIAAVKIALVSLTCFFGAGFTMITYNTDTGVKDVLANLQQIYTGKVSEGSSILEIGYAIGIVLGVIIFFNHTAGKRRC